MAWSFLQEDVKNLLDEKVVVVIGDSIMRGMYKDILCLLTEEGRLLRPKELKVKGELEFLGDKLLKGGKLGKLNNGTSYTEVRRVDTGHTVVRFYFVTRCFSKCLQAILDELKKFLPDVIIMNSCVWDIHRYGPHGLTAFKQNLQKLVVAVKDSMGSDTLFIWTGSLPMATKCKGGFLLPYCDTIPSREVVEANYYAHDLMSKYDHIFLDLYTMFSVQLHHRTPDGIHWNNIAHRRMSNVLLSQISKSWQMPLPRHFPGWHPSLVKSDLYKYPGSTKLACSHGGSIGFTTHLQTVELPCGDWYGGVGRSSCELAGSVPVASSSSSSEEMSKEEAYKNRFEKFALVTRTLPVNGLKENKTPTGNVTTVQSNYALKDPVLIPTAAPTNEVKAKLVETSSMKQFKFNAQVIGMCKTNAEAENSKYGHTSTEKNVKAQRNGQKRKKDNNEPLEKPVGASGLSERQIKKLKCAVPTIYNLQPIKAYPLSPADQVQNSCHPLKPRNLTHIPMVPVIPTGHAYSIDQLLKPKNTTNAVSKVPAPAHTGQSYCVNHLLKPSNVAVAAPKVPMLGTGQASYPNHLLKPSNVAVAVPKVPMLGTGQTSYPNHLLKPSNVAVAAPKVPMLGTGQASYPNHLLKPSNVAVAVPKVPMLGTGQASYPNHLLKPISNLTMANSRFHPYAWYQPQRRYPAPLKSWPQGPRSLMYRPTALGYSYRSWRSHDTSETPYQEVQKLIGKEVASRFHCRPVNRE